MAFACLLFYRIDWKLQDSRKNLRAYILRQETCGEKQPLCRYWLSLDAVLHHWLHSAGWWVDELFWLRGSGWGYCPLLQAPGCNRLIFTSVSHFFQLGKIKKKKLKTSLSQTCKIPWSVVFCNNFTTPWRMIQRILWSWAVHRLLQLSLGFQHTHSVRTCLRMSRGRCSYPHSWEGRQTLKKAHLNNSKTQKVKYILIANSEFLRPALIKYKQLNKAIRIRKTIRKTIGYSITLSPLCFCYALMYLKGPVCKL